MPGPIIIFDKSALESLNVDEALWLDNFFLSNITPLLFVETLADVQKQVARGRTPEQVVGRRMSEAVSDGSRSKLGRGSVPENPQDESCPAIVVIRQIAEERRFSQKLRNQVVGGYLAEAEPSWFGVSTSL
jgi:hypothetical protein